MIKQYSGRTFEKMLREHGIEEFNGPQGRILYVLWEEDAISIQELSDKSGLANTTLTSMLDRMEAKALIERRPDPQDRRKNRIALTAKARSLRQAYEEVSSRMTELLYRGFSGPEMDRIEQDLERILANLNPAAAAERNQ